MTLQTLLQIFGFLGAAVAGSIGTWKVVDELLRKGRTALREDYRFAREFLTRDGVEDAHPVVAELGYQAIAGDARVSADEVTYLLTLQRPREAIRSFSSARQLLAFYTTAPLHKLSFRSKYQSPARRRALKIWYAVAYFTTYALGFSPLPLVSMGLLSSGTGLSLFVLTGVMFFPLAFLSLKASRRLTLAGALLRMQAESKGILTEGAGQLDAAPNPSIERTAPKRLRHFGAVAHVKR